ncbi:helix-turn-helix transcriptional regulator [Neorhizobium sp. NPDC001467]|uniref:helix-turn-helix transcriptional regulator n=1 Tax=Neorhizobium sp. NPDC001467 TaxID=3390595 RepID=UPI003CFDB54B
MRAEDTLADRLYEAAMIPEMWEDACGALAATVGSSTASIFTVDTLGKHRFVTTSNIADAFGAFIESEHRFNNLRPIRAMERFPFSFARTTDLMTPEEYAGDAINRDFIHPHGMEWEAGYAFQEPTGHIVVISLMRAFGLAHFSVDDLQTLNRLKPDIARAAYMASRLSFKEARSMTQTLSMLGLPAAVIGDAGQVLVTNPELDALTPRIRTVAANRLIVDNPGARALLEDAIARYRGQAQPTVQSVPIPGYDGAPPLIAHLLPIRRAARDIFSRAMALLAVTEVAQVGPPDMRVLCGLFDLTPAEARVARGMALAQTPEMVAAALGVSVETARSHLKRIMRKTGTTRQAELVLLLSGLSTPGTGPGGN